MSGILAAIPWVDFKTRALELTPDEFVGEYSVPFLLFCNREAKDAMGRLLDTLAEETKLDRKTVKHEGGPPKGSQVRMTVYELKFDSSWEDPLAIRIGRVSTNEICIPKPELSKHHATILRQAGGNSLSIVDEGSTNGSFINGERLESGRPRALENRDALNFSPGVLSFYFEPKTIRDLAEFM